MIILRRRRVPDQDVSAGAQDPTREVRGDPGAVFFDPISGGFVGGSIENGVPPNHPLFSRIVMDFPFEFVFLLGTHHLWKPPFILMDIYFRAWGWVTGKVKTPQFPGLR